MNLEEGKKLVKLARLSINSEESSYIKNEFNEKRGVFVTLHQYPNMDLRGCIGFVEPIFSLREAVIRAAKASAFSDPRFIPVDEKEMKSIVVEVSVLTNPKKIEDPLNNIKIGKDGLIVGNGLLLPQVCVEQKWGVKTFLEHTCYKSGLDKNYWKDNDVYKFQAEIFSEIEPNGEVEKCITS